jgi:hypothetical protein
LIEVVMRSMFRKTLSLDEQNVGGSPKPVMMAESEPGHANGTPMPPLSLDGPPESAGSSGSSQGGTQGSVTKLRRYSSIADSTEMAMASRQDVPRAHTSVGPHCPPGVDHSDSPTQLPTRLPAAALIPLRTRNGELEVLVGQIEVLDGVTSSPQTGMQVRRVARGQKIL